ncbi:6-hydroxymethylpterin diphosphokinase MptE-like protein [Natronosalvus vescus]|uniref:6-hydroxymethylpterin diphosphokinase MptE-like protein n=1 Tax=Natronosalvus vescus TaxID=2953881 RepID=UPI0020900DED|nr:6-hydroxymethylpterin diphosphokinase MptE-like protein [Natronosalvus vescus]
MDVKTWLPVYDALLADFGFDRAADERARDVLGVLTGPFDCSRLERVSGGTVAIAGAGPSLESPDALEAARAADVVFAASTAVDVLEANDVAVHCMITDLDKNPETVVRLTERGTPVAVHAHGDNIPAVRSIVPACDDAFVLPTTQAEPVGPVRNFGGFTDGDRAAFLADHLGAAELVFVGWDFDDPSVDPMKVHKLEWAERLLYWLEIRRGERFDVLDGRRDAIDTSVLLLE